MKKIKFCISITIVFIILGLQISSVIAVSENSFFYTNKQEISIGETLELTLDISKVQYDEFEFKLLSNLDTNNIVINENVEVENYNNDISINIDKSKININKIIFYYQIPETSQIGTKIELIAQIIAETEKEVLIENNNNEEITNNDEQIGTDNTIENNSIKNETELSVVDSKKIDVKIVENQQTNNQEKPTEQNSNDKVNALAEQEKPNVFDKSDKSNTNIPNNVTNKIAENFGTDISNKSMPSNKQTISYSTSSINLSSMPSQTETAVYNGSSNNYLSSLEVDGESLNTTFNKENLTYFVKTTGKNVLNVIATAEDGDAKINITGNENLKTGDNKILISVTAENGDVRYYRVFVTNN